MGTSSPDLLLQLDRAGPRGLRAQIEGELRAAIRSGRLAPGTTLPSTRALAADLGVTRGVVVDAFDQLVAEGWLRSRPGARAVVAETPQAPERPVVERPAGPPVDIHFRTGHPDLSAFPRTAWARATRTALQTLPDVELGYGDRRGAPVLRTALAAYLGRVRGVSVDPAQLVVCSGFGHGLHLTAGALRGRGIDVVAVEDPGYDSVRDVLGAVGIRSVPVAVDGDGLVVDELRATAARAVVVTPSHQSPTGTVLPADRRQALVAWAREVDGFVIEDDYDAEYRFDRRPVGALQGIAPDRVVYCGTASKSLAPALRLGWLALPAELVEPIVVQREVSDGSTSSLLQATYAAFVEAGDLDRHLRRMRRTYRQRRDALVDALARHLPDAVPSGVAAGLQVLVTLPPGPDEGAVHRRALELGVEVHPLAEFRCRPAPGAPAAFVLGYGSLTPEQAERGVAVLARAVADVA